MMILLRSIPLLLLFPLMTNVDGQSIDSSASRVTFKVGNMKIHSVDGSFSGIRGTVTFDPARPSDASFKVCVDARTVDTDNKKRDEHLRSEAFFDVTTYPAICFTSTSVERTGDAYLAKGTLTMHGVTKEVQIPFSHASGAFTGTLVVKRLDYGVGADMGTFMVGDEVDITLVCVTR